MFFVGFLFSDRESLIKNTIGLGIPVLNATRDRCQKSYVVYEFW